MLIKHTYNMFIPDIGLANGASPEYNSYMCLTLQHPGPPVWISEPSGGPRGGGIEISLEKISGGERAAWERRGQSRDRRRVIFGRGKGGRVGNRGWDGRTAGKCRGSARVRGKTGEGDAGKFCAQIGMGRRTCGDTMYAYMEGGMFGHRTDKS